jgi:hypothetical protein
MASGVQRSPTASGSPSAPTAGSPCWSRTAVTGTTSHCVPLAASVEYALARPSGLVGSGPKVNDPRFSSMTRCGSSGSLNWNSPIRSAIRTGSSTLPRASSRARK